MRHLCQGGSPGRWRASPARHRLVNMIRAPAAPTCANTRDTARWASISSATRPYRTARRRAFWGLIQRYRPANDRAVLRRGLRHEIASLPRPYAFAPSNWSGPLDDSPATTATVPCESLSGNRQKRQTDDAGRALFAIHVEETAVLPEQFQASRPGLVRCCPAPL
jgi:hypothetical protein